MNGIRERLGTFETERGAAAAYNQAAKRLHGDFALLNDVPEIDYVRRRAGKGNQVKRSPRASKYTGVYWYPRLGKWGVQIRDHYKHVWLGSYDNEEDAARAYNEAAIRLREFPHLNVIEE